MPRPQTPRRPEILLLENQYSVNVVRHQYKRIENYVREMSGNLSPAVPDDVAQGVGYDLLANELTEHRAPIPRNKS
jgi:hypothetical protein